MKMTLQPSGCGFFKLLVLLVIALGQQVQSEQIIKRLGETFFVNCPLTNGGNLTWKGPKGQALGPTTDPKAQTATYGTVLYFTKVIKSFSGPYTCSSDTKNSTVWIIVQDPLNFVDTNPEQTGVEFTDVLLRCEVVGGDNPTITWSVLGGEIKGPKYEIMADGLLIRNVTWGVLRKYICKATQENTGEVRDKHIRLKVRHKPYPVPSEWPKEEKLYGIVGSKVNLTCESVAEPPPTFEWYRQEGRAVKNDVDLFETPYKSILQIKMKNQESGGIFRCRASNKYGSIIKVISLEEGSLPDIPDVVMLKDAGSTFLNISIRGPQNVTNNMPPTSYSIKFRIEDEKNQAWNERRFDVSADNSYLLKKLSPKTSYEVKAATINVVGKSEYTNSSTYVTLNASSLKASYSLLGGVLVVIFKFVSFL